MRGKRKQKEIFHEDYEREINKVVYTAYVAPSDVRNRKRDGPTDGRTDGHARL